MRVPPFGVLLPDSYHPQQAGERQGAAKPYPDHKKITTYCKH